MLRETAVTAAVPVRLMIAAKTNATGHDIASKIQCAVAATLSDVNNTKPNDNFVLDQLAKNILFLSPL